MLKKKQKKKHIEKEATGKKMDPEEKNLNEETAEQAETAGEQAAEAQEPEQRADKEPELTEADKLKQQNAELTDRLKRNMAEFDNYRKRTEKEKAARFEMGARGVVEKLLPVIDNFERGLGTLTEEQKEEAFASGMDKVYKQMTGILKELGAEPIEAVGKPFDPGFHNAVMHVEDEEAGENTVVEEFQKGYTMNGTVVRYSMVKVAN